VNLGPLPDALRSRAQPPPPRNRRRLIAPALVVILIAVAVAVVATRGSKSSPPPDTSYDGTIYIESNEAAPNANSVLAFRYKDGNLRPLSVREYLTGGSGSHDLSNHGVLDAEQQVVTNADHTLLFAPNAGSDTVAVFHIRDDGSLGPVTGSPFPSLGPAPASLGVSGDELIVANKAQDGTRPLKKTPANYATFHIGKDGRLTPLGSPIEAPPKSSPTQTYLPPPHTGHLMISTEESGPFRAFTIGSDGRLTQAPGSPHLLEDAVWPGGKRKPKPRVWPQGLAAHPKLPLLYAGVANIRRLAVYRYDPSGRLTLASSQLNRGAYLPCWTQVNRDGTRLYTGNAGSGNISVFDTERDPVHPRQIQQIDLRGLGLPWNFQLDPTGRFLFIINMRAVRQIPPGQGNTLHSFRIAPDGRLSELPSSPVPIPVPLNTNPWGMAVVARTH
jgi:DNA-binding beta-propeller fold protein YncE